MNFDKIKQEINIVSYLKSIDCSPQFENEYTARFIAPYRADTSPSLSVNKVTNLFFDHGTGAGGNIIQLVALINKCNDYQAAKMLTDQKKSFSFHCKPILKQSTSIKLNKIKKLENIALRQYLQSRDIDIQIAQQYCKECYYSVANKNYFALAFENDKGGYELRNKYFKGCVGSKNISSINNGSDTLQIFEGFIDLLSFVTHYGQDVMLSFDTIVLNSLSCIEKAKPLFSCYQKIHLYLDNDYAGKNLTKQLLSQFPTTIDCSFQYEKYKDFNDFLISVRRTKRSEESHRRGYVSGCLKPCFTHPDRLKNEY